MRKHRFYSLLLAGILLTGGFNGLIANPSTHAYVEQQTNVIKGTVTDEKGEPLIGVNVTVKNASVGGITDVNGIFSLNAPNGSTLVISYIGYITQEIIVKGTTPLKITLVEDSKTLDVSSVKAEELNSVASSSVSQMLQGKVSGMNSIQSSAQPGAGMSINIRGAASPNGSNAPLYVIDGVPLQTN